MKRGTRKKISNGLYSTYPFLLFPSLYLIFTNFFYCLIPLTLFYFIRKFQNKAEKQWVKIHDRRVEQLKKTHTYLGLASEGYGGDLYSAWKNNETGEIGEKNYLIKKMILNQREKVKAEIALNNLFSNK